MSHSIQEDICLNYLPYSFLLLISYSFLKHFLFNKYETFNFEHRPLTSVCLPLRTAAGRVTHEQQRWPAGGNDSAAHDQEETEHAVISVAPWFPVVYTHTHTVHMHAARHM